MVRNFLFAFNEFYHIYNRGVDKRTVFLDDSDRDRFLVLLYLCNSIEAVHISAIQGSTLKDFLNVDKGEVLVSIGAYCLMPNHFHILIREKTEGGVSLFMQKVSTAYTMYFNMKYKRTGPLFAGRFKAQHAADDNYLKYLFAYIHLNPVKLIEPRWREEGILNITKVTKYLDSYRYSSYFDYKEINRMEKIILNSTEFPEYFQGLSDFEEQTKDWLFLDEDHKSFQGSTLK